MMNPIAFQIAGYAIHWYGIIIAIGLLLAILLAMHHMKREGHDPDSVLDLALIIVPLAVIGARAYYVISKWTDIYSLQPFWKVFAVWEGGLGIYGGVIGGFVGVLIYWFFVNKKKIPLLSILDIVAPSLILGQAIGRWGNFVNQEAYGYAVTDPAWQWFPAAVYIQSPDIFDGLIHTYPGPGWYMATFFYESIWNFLVFAFLFFYFKNSKTRKPGNVLWFYLLLYGIGRAVIEGLRTDSLYMGSTGIRTSQLLSILLVIASAVILLIPVAKKIILSRRDAETNTKLDDSLKLIPDEDISDDGVPAEEGTVEEPAEQAPAGDEAAAPDADEADGKREEDSE